MLLQELFDRLATGELKQHSMGKTGVILPENYSTIINQLNMGLTNLHAFFPISEKSVVIRQFDHITDYKLSSAYAVSTDDDDVLYKWILDSVYNPFQDDVIRIERAYDEVGYNIPLNDTYNSSSIFTSAWDTIQIPYPLASNVALLVYRANHPKIATDADPATTYINIPPVLEEALQAFIASRAFVSLGNADSAALATYFSNQYHQSIQDIERNNLFQSSDGDSNLGVTYKGFI